MNRSRIPAALAASVALITAARAQTAAVQVPNLAALQAYTTYSTPVIRDGYANPGDGGRGVYVHAAGACSPTQDGGYRINAADGGCWNLDLASTGGNVFPCLFENCATATDDTAAIQTAYKTGHTVYLGGARSPWVISSDVTRSTPGQVTYGDGRDRTFVTASSPKGFTNGLFVDATGEPGPVDHDYSVYVTQPDTSALASLNQFPPLFYARSTPRFRMEHMGCFLGIKCIDMQGNSGGAYIDDLEFNAFSLGIAIDGSLDTIRVTRPHWFPFRMTSNQQALFFSQTPTGTSPRPVGISLGRADDFNMSDGLFIGGLAMVMQPGADGNEPGGLITNTDFDTYSGIYMVAGDFVCSSCSFSLGVANAQALSMVGGRMSLASPLFAIGAALTAPAVQIVGDGSHGVPVLSVSGGHGIDLGQSPFDVTVFRVGGGGSSVGEIDIHDWGWFDNVPGTWSGTTFTNPVIQQLASGRLIAVGNKAIDKGTGSGTFISIGSDNFNSVIGNKAPGWTNTFQGGAMPNSLTGYTGSYFGN